MHLMGGGSRSSPGDQGLSLSLLHGPTLATLAVAATVLWLVIFTRFPLGGFTRAAARASAPVLLRGIEPPVPALSAAKSRQAQGQPRYNPKRAYQCWSVEIRPWSSKEVNRTASVCVVKAACVDLPHKTVYLHKPPSVAHEDRRVLDALVGEGLSTTWRLNTSRDRQGMPSDSDGGDGDATASPAVVEGLTWLEDVTHAKSRQWNNINHFGEGSLIFAQAAWEAGLPAPSTTLFWGIDPASSAVPWMKLVAAAAARAGAAAGASLPPPPLRALYRADLMRRQGGTTCYRELVGVSKNSELINTPARTEGCDAVRAALHAAIGFRAARPGELRRGGHWAWGAWARGWAAFREGWDGGAAKGEVGQAGGGAPARSVLLLQRSTHGRRMRNGEEVVAFAARAARRHGFAFDTADFDMPPFRGDPAAQMRAFASAGVVVGFHGAGLTNVVAAAPGSVLVEIFNCGHQSWTYRNVAAACRVHHRRAPPLTTRRLEGFAGGLLDCAADSVGRRFFNENRTITEAELAPHLVWAMQVVAAERRLHGLY